MKPGAAALALLLLAAPAAAEDSPPSAARLMDDLMWGRGPIGGPFTLTDQHGANRTDREFHGQWLLLYFGYTYCPDVCPTDLLSISQAIEQLGPDGARVQPIFITVDPGRDTPQQLALYAEAFHPRLVALTGPQSAITAVARGYKAYFARVETGDASGYVVDHTSFIYIVDADGQYRGFLPPGTPPERIVEAMRSYLR